MKYNGWDKYNKNQSHPNPNRPSSTGAKSSTQPSQKSVRERYSSGKLQRNSPHGRRAAKKRVDNLKKATAATLATLFLIGVVWWANVNNREDISIPDDNTTTTEEVVFDTTYSDITTGEESITTPPVVEELEYTYEELLDYKDFGYVQIYGGKPYLFATEDYLRDAFEAAKAKINKMYGDSGKLEPYENGEYVSKYITLEDVLAMSFNESSWRICHEDGYPLLAYSKYGLPEEEAATYAGGIAQQQAVFVKTADEYSRRYGGDGYTLEDRYNPVQAFEIAILNLNRIYNAYLAPGNKTHKALCPNMYNSKGEYIGNTTEEMAKENDYVIKGALWLAYRQGEGTMQAAAQKDNLRSRILSGDDKYVGIAYYQKLLYRASEIEKDDDYEMRP